MSAVDEVLKRAARRDGVVTVREAEALGLAPRALQRLATGGRWQRVSSGVYVTHNGPLSWRTTARAGLAAAGDGAALSHRAAAHLHGFAPAPKRLDVTVPHRRRVVGPPGVRVHRATRRDVEVKSRLLVVSAPDAVLDIAAGVRGVDDVIGVVADAVRAGTWPSMILRAVDRRPNERNRALVAEMVAHAERGIESPLELRYHRDVERAHRLPRSVLQHRAVVDTWWIRADCIYDGLGVRCELDGGFAHPGGRTDRDTWRDNAVVIERAEITLRYRWHHVATTPCRTAAQVVAALRGRGWRGHPYPCAPDCPVR